jgi:glycerol-3-phosphate dehydrogenase (NAD(P)+)
MHIGIVGAGAWGTALAAIAAKNNHDVLMWAVEPSVVADINNNHKNDEYLSGAVLPPTVRASSVLSHVVTNRLVINAIPTQHIRSVWQNVHPVERGSILVNVSKGIEVGTHLRVSELFAALNVGFEFVVLSGPSHAEEVVQFMPTTVVCAGNDQATVVVQEIFSHPTFRVYTSSDVVGVEICGALKNVVAIAAGVVDGLGLGDNTKAALITRGLREISKLGVALGANTSTFYGLAGLGDLYVTCSSKHSRNRAVGERIGKGESLNSIIASMHAVAEGVPTTTAALELASVVGVELPITQKMFDIMQGADARSAINSLMMRPKRTE